jgi:hypothetical protein
MCLTLIGLVDQVMLGQPNTYSNSALLYFSTYSVAYILNFVIAGAGAVFNLLCGETDNTVMRKIETYFQHNVPEVCNCKMHMPVSCAPKH